MKVAATILLLSGCASCGSAADDSPAEANLVAPVGASGERPKKALAASKVEKLRPEPAEAKALLLEEGGLRVVAAETGPARPLPFGSPEPRMLTALAAVLGEPVDRGVNEECGAGKLSYVEWKGELSTWFQDGRFAGWESKGALTTADGIVVGATRVALEQSGNVELPESTIGTEFISGELSGLLSSSAADAKITELWAGTTCIFR